MISSATSSSSTTTNTITTTNVKKHLEEHTKFYGSKVVDWLAKGSGDIYDEKVNEKVNEKNDNVLKYNDDVYIINYDKDLKDDNVNAPKYDNVNAQKYVSKHANLNENIINQNIDVSININDDNEISSSFQSSQKEYFKEEGQEEGQEYFKEGSSKEGSFQEESIQSFEETLQISSTSSNSTSSTPYSAELVQTPTGSFSSYENESPIRPLKAMTRSNNNDKKRTSSVYEILQEIKPERPLRINTQFEFNTNNLRPSPLLHSPISHNPLSHHHRNSALYIDNSSPISARNSRRNSRNSINYTPPRRYSNTPPRRYSNIQRSSITKSFYENKNDINNYFNVIQEKNEKNIINNNDDIVNNINNEENINYNNNINNNKRFDKDDDDENKMYIKYFFWFGFLFMPIWWFGSFYKPNGTEDYKWRKRCRMASIWVIIISVVALIIFLIIEQRLKSGM